MAESEMVDEAFDRIIAAFDRACSIWDAAMKNSRQDVRANLFALHRKAAAEHAAAVADWRAALQEDTQ